MVLWVVDDEGWANVGFHNPGNVKTPNADRVASAGIILDHHYTYRWCAPTRSALMTGRLPYHVFQASDHVDRAFSMLPSKLRQVRGDTSAAPWRRGSSAARRPLATSPPSRTP